MNLEFINALDEIEKDKGISKDVLIEAIESALLSAYKKDFGSKENVRIDIVEDQGEVKVYSQREIVEEVENSKYEISLEKAREIDPSYDVGDIVEDEITPANFGRIAAQTAKQVVMQRIREAERDVIYDHYKKKEGELITGTIQRFHYDNILIDMGKTEALLPPPEQIPGEVYEKGKRIKLYIVEVSSTTKGPRILVSRTHPNLLKRLFELEVPEIYDGTVEIRAVAREAGRRSKMAVTSRDENVDPVGSCVGPKGMRVQAVVDQLNGEKIDIIEWNEDPGELISNALNPAEVISVDTDENEKVAEVVVPDFQLSLAIGKEGQNARLAAKLTGWKVDIKKESEVNNGEQDQDENETNNSKENVKDENMNPDNEEPITNQNNVEDLEFNEETEGNETDSAEENSKNE